MTHDLASAVADLERVRDLLARRGRPAFARAGKDAPRKLDTFATTLVGPVALPVAFRALYTVFDHIEGVAAPLSALAKALKAQHRAGQALVAPIAPRMQLALPDAGFGDALYAYLFAATGATG